MASEVSCATINWFDVSKYLVWLKVSMSFGSPHCKCEELGLIVPERGHQDTWSLALPRHGGIGRLPSVGRKDRKFSWDRMSPMAC